MIYIGFIMSKNFYVLASLHDESNSGWVWVPESSSKEYNSRDLVKIEVEETGKKIYTVCRIIDDNFLRRYNHKLKDGYIDDKECCNSKKDNNNCDKTVFIREAEKDDYVVISDYYRAKLGINTSYYNVNKGNNPENVKYSLSITKVCNCDIFIRIYYLFKHPDVMVQGKFEKRPL